MATKEEKRIDILNAAIKVISEAGFEGAKIEDIAKEAGIGKGTVYEYFESKNTLFLEMIHYSVEQYQAGLSKALAEGNNMLAKIRNLSSYCAEFLNNHLAIANSSISCGALPEEMRAQMMKDWDIIQKTIEDEVRIAIQTSEIRANIDPEMATAVIIGGIKQYITKKLFMDRVSLDEINHDGIAKVILTGLIG